MVDLDAAELLNQINELGKCVHMCCTLPYLYLRSGSSRVTQFSPPLVLPSSGPCWRLQGQAIAAVIQKSSREETLREPSKGWREEMFLLGVEGWRDGRLCRGVWPLEDTV